MQKQRKPSSEKNSIEGDQTELLMNHLSLNQLDYNLELFQIGIQFLDSIFPEKDPMYEPHFKSHASNARYWRWWKSEWSCWQQDLLRFHLENKVPLSRSLWLSEMQQMAGHKLIEDSFYTYLKLSTINY